MQLSDGRSLAFECHGGVDGLPVLFFHGTPGSRKYWSLVSPPRLAADADVRLIAFDRPGMGMSDAAPARSVGSLVSDVEELADALALDRFSLLSFSGGSGYALAVAAAMPERIVSVALVAPIGDLSVGRLLSSLDPAVKRALSLASRAEVLCASPLIARMSARSLVKLVAEQAWTHLPAADRRALHSTPMRTAVAEMLEEAARGGVEGPRLDLELLAKPWGFNLGDVTVPVDVFAGGADPWSTDDMVHWLEVGLSDCRVQRMPGEGHFTILTHRASEVLTVLVERAHAGRTIAFSAPSGAAVSDSKAALQYGVAAE